MSKKLHKSNKIDYDKLEKPRNILLKALRKTLEKDNQLSRVLSFIKTLPPCIDGEFQINTNKKTKKK